MNTPTSPPPTSTDDTSTGEAPEADRLSHSFAMAVCLRVVVVVQCFGLGARYLFSSLETESDVYGWLYFDRDWPESIAQSIDNIGALTTLFAGGILCLNGWLIRKPSSDFSRNRIAGWMDRAAAVWIAIWMLLIATAHMMRAAVFAELSLPEHAVRYMSPLALAVCGGTGVGMCVSLVRTRIAVILLVVSASLTFAAHGYKAYECYAPFIDLILLSDMRWTGAGLTQATAEKLLVVIGIADILVALVLLVFRSRFAAFYMVVWGLVTAASRMTALGLDAWPESLIRIANGGVPIVVLIHWTAKRK